MRTLIIAAALVLPFFALVPVEADHPQTVAGRYMLTSLVEVRPVPPLGYTTCNTSFYTDDLVGCLGGGVFHTHNPGTMSNPGVDCSAAPEECHVYRQADAITIDLLSGPDVYVIHCMPNPSNPGGIGGCNNEKGIDGYQDVAAQGCGISLPLDATDIHAGNHHTVVFAFTVFVDDATNEVCIGTQGEASIVFT